MVEQKGAAESGVEEFLLRCNNIKYVKKACFCGFAVFAVLALVGCNSSPEVDDPVLVNTVQHRVIIDCDALGDDATAVSLLAKASNITLEGITVVGGYVDIQQAADNILMTLEMAGRTEIPVYRGSETSLSGEKQECYSIYGKDGMGDADLIHPTGEAQEEYAIDFILETVRKYPGEIEILVTGPVTNIALAIQQDSETMKQVKRIWTMGTSGFGEGNATPVAEYNVYNDAAAFKVMMESGIPVTVVGLDMCGADNIVYHLPEMAELAASSELGNYHVTSWNKLFEYKSSVKCASVVCTDKGATFGQVVLYREGYTYDSMPDVTDYNATVVTSVCEYRYKSAVKQLLSSY